jgi:RimJ/RimL family protein N-acetyltransferase
VRTLDHADVGVAPEQRGHGYARELLAWMVRWQAEQGAEKVVGETDDANVPMAKAFEAVGFVLESAGSTSSADGTGNGVWFSGAMAQCHLA